MFSIQKESDHSVNKIIKNNIIIDTYYKNNLTEMLSFDNSLLKYYLEAKALNKNELEKKVDIALRNSLLMATLFLTGECNANCPICYTDRKQKNNELSFEEIEKFIRFVKKLGVKILYIPGEGEPTLDKSLFKILELSKELEIKVIIFTNGIIFSDEKTSKSKWSISTDKLIKKLRDYPVYIYYKLWTTDKKLTSKLLGIDSSIYNFKLFKYDNKNINIPLGLIKLMKLFPKDRLGIQSTVLEDNIEEIKYKILPFIKFNKLNKFIESKIYTGRCKFDNFNKTNDLLNSIELDKTNCNRLTYKITLHNDGFLTATLSYKSDNLKNENKGLYINQIDDFDDFIKKIHTNKFFLYCRYYLNKGCLCQTLNINLQNAKENEIIEYIKKQNVTNNN